MNRTGPKALFSVRLHKELEHFARKLTKAGWKIICTSEAASFLREKGIETIDVSDFTGIKTNYGFPPTLHPKMEAALTTNFKERIDLVYDIPYRINIGNDVGGRTLLALAAKGNRIPVMNIEDMGKVVKGIEKEGKIKSELKSYLIDKANFEISRHFLQLTSKNGRFRGIVGSKYRVLLNGENMYQIPAILFKTETDDSLAISEFKQVAGLDPCFTNIVDLNCILDTICKLQSSLTLNGIKKAYITIAAKHGNPCGVGVSLDKPSGAIEKALWGNAKGIWVKREKRYMERLLGCLMLLQHLKLQIVP
jgi:AICAR transformylase/IMP cyclohydrolase PurH